MQKKKKNRHYYQRQQWHTPTIRLDATVNLGDNWAVKMKNRNYSRQQWHTPTERLDATVNLGDNWAVKMNNGNCWRQHTGLCEFLRNILTNICRLGKGRGLKIGVVSYSFIFYNITISELVPLDCFRFIFIFAWQWTIYSLLWSPVSPVGRSLFCVLCLMQE